MKKWSVVFILAFSKWALADVACLGETTRDKTSVTVRISNEGVIGATQHGRVEIRETSGRVREYLILQEDISQFYEGLRGARANMAMIGFEAYAFLNNPISISYVGKNFNQVPLNVAMNDSSRVKDAGNRMIVWRGSGFKSDEQYTFEDVVCSVIQNP